MANPETRVDDTQANNDFTNGFTSETPPDATAAMGTEPKSDPPSPKTEPVTPPKPTAAAPAPVAPKYVQITQEQFEAFRSSAAETTEMRKQMSKAFGTMGQLQQVVSRLQSQTPAGMSIEIPKDAFADMEKDFPEFAASMRKGLEATLKNVRGTGQQRPGDNADPDAVQKLIQAATVKLEIEALEDAHPTWRDIVGVVDSEGKHDTGNPFRQWLAKQDAAYQHRINATNSATIISRAIDRFVAETKATVRPNQTQTPKNAAQRDRIRSAIQPRGDGGQPAPMNSADDAFREGFASG